MKLIAKKKAIARLRSDLAALADEVRTGYEHAAKDCAECDVKGSCCADAHFVNVRITPLEAAAIRGFIDRLSPEMRERFDRKIADTVSRYGLDRESPSASAYPCPLLDDDNRCIVHGVAKPVPCILHACYDRKEDMPPDDLQAAMETSIARFNLLTYGKPPVVRPLPVAIMRR
jgi:hypothetical protein